MNRENFIKFYSIGDFVLTFFWILLFILNLADIIDIEKSPFNVIDTLILIFFFISYLIKLLLSKNKKSFFVKNIFDLLAIVPLHFFNSGILARSNRVFRIINLLGKLGHKKNSILYRNGFIYALYSSACIIFVGSGFFSEFENIKYTDSIWWSVVTMTTVGYGDISPQTTEGKVVASITMIFGIGFISMLTSTLTTYFKTKKTNTSSTQNEDSEIKKLHKKIDHLTETIEYLSKTIEKDK